jgi:hypothetical protein
MGSRRLVIVAGLLRLSGRSRLPGLIGIPYAGKFFGAVKALSALSAAVGAEGQEKQDPEFENAPTFCTMHMRALADKQKIQGHVSSGGHDTAQSNPAQSCDLQSSWVYSVAP